MSESTNTGDRLGGIRLFIGLAQGIGFLLLTRADDSRVWPATDPLAFSTLALCTTYVATTALVAVGQLRPAALIVWLAAAVGLVGVTTWHAVARGSLGPQGDAAALYLILAPVFFVAYHLVAAADLDRRPIASYHTYFDIGWKNGVQLALSLAFVGALWLLLFLGASLFELIKVKAVREVIERDWFVFPVTAAMFALAVHVTDVRSNLIKGIRNVSLVLLSWLLPVMTLLAAAFVATLPATGLEPLWATTYATPILLTAAGALVVLVNAAYQDGEAETHTFLRFAARVASVALVPLVALAFYSVWLRVQQHGLTPDRVIVLAVIAIGACYAIGYVAAAIWPGRWLKPLELTNVATAVVAVGLAVALLTPLADPARLSVDDQLRRLRTGVVTPEKFDYDFLRDEGARYGRDALAMLARDQSSERARQIATRAQQTLANSNPAGPPKPELTTKELLAKIVVRPGGGRLPESFVNQDWNTTVPADCPAANVSGKECRAYLIDFDGDGVNEVVIATITSYQVYRQWSDGRWRVLGYFDLMYCGFSTEEALVSGRYRLMPSREIEFNGHRIRLQGCPEEPIPATGGGSR